MKTIEEFFESNGFDFESFAFENEYSAKNLLNAVKEYASQSKWISVQENPPTEDGEYWGYSEDYEKAMIVVWHKGDFYSYANDGELVSTEFADSITMYQSLPEKPQQ